MNYRLLLVDGNDEAITAELRIRTLREFPGLDGVSVHFRPVRNDLLFASASFSGRLAYRILLGEGIVRSQLWVEYEVLGERLNVVGRSSDLLFALALITSKWRPSAQFSAIAATGVLDDHGRVLGVEQIEQKLSAAARDLASASNAVIFYPAADSQVVAQWMRASKIPVNLDLRPVATLDEALAQLGYVLENVYLGNPFRGLEHFDYGHRAIFFGRDVEVGEVLEQLLRRETAGVPGVLIEGPSGSGKSSFLRAGVLPAVIDSRHQSEYVQLALRDRPMSPGASRAIWRPGLMPSSRDELAMVQSIRECWSSLGEWSVDSLRTGIETLNALAVTRRLHWPSNRRFVWVIDQFEELFSLELGHDALDALGCFLGQLQLDGVWTLASVRADSMPQLKQHEALRAIFGANEGLYYLPTLKGLALDDVIIRPAKAAELTFGVGPNGERLEQLLRDEVYREPDALPLLQFTLNELYQNRSGNELTYEAYRQLGGVSGSIATRAEAVLKSDSVESRQAVRRLFRNLVGIDETGRATRRYASMSAVMRDPSQKLLALRLTELRLCVTDEREGLPVVAFAHDALLQKLPPLIQWLRDEAALLQAREDAQREARLWQQNAKSDAWLATSDKLLAFEALEEADVALAPEVSNFINRSRRLARRASRIRQTAVSLIATLAIVATIGAWIAVKKQREAEYQNAQTLRAQGRLLTETASDLLAAGDVGGAQALILEVLRNNHATDPEATNVFQEARAADRQLVVLTGHTGWVTSAQFSPDGKRIVTASADGTARVWDVDTGQQILILRGNSILIRSAAFSPDAKRIVAGCEDRTARIWNAESGEQLLVLRGHTGGVTGTAFSPDGRQVVTASADKSARLWDALNGKQIRVFVGHGDSVFSAVFSPDGRRIVTASFDKTARVWEAASGRQLAVMRGHTDLVYGAAFSPDGQRVITASFDKTARIWNAATAEQLLVLNAHAERVRNAAFSPDGQHVVTASLDGTARVWDATSGEQLLVLRGHRDLLESAAYSPDGRRIVTASFDGTARIWDVSSAQLQLLLTGHTDRLFSAAFSSDGKRIATASGDKTARVWDAANGMPQLILSGHADHVESAAFAVDGRRIVTGSFDGTARLWDAVSGKQLLVLRGHTAQVDHAAFSPDGRHVVTASDDKTARIWDANTGAQLMLLKGHADIVQDAEFSADGSRIVTASFDHTARIWDATSGRQLLVMSGHTGPVSSAAFSPDGTRVITASGDGTARIWAAATGQELLQLRGHTSGVSTAVFSPRGKRVLTSSADKTVRIWDAASGRQLLVLEGHGDAVNSAYFSTDEQRVVSASFDKTARVWDASTPEFEVQFRWAQAAEWDPVPATDRFRFGLPATPNIRPWPQAASKCDQAAAAPYDPARRAQGVMLDQIVADVASPACNQGKRNEDSTGRLGYQKGRVLVAMHDFAGARRELELARGVGYAASGIDLGMLLTRPAAGMVDIPGAIAIYEEAWNRGVKIAAFELGRLYEKGVKSAESQGQYLLAPDGTMAWSWYQKAAAASEPDALARFGERASQLAYSAGEHSKRDRYLLESLKYYAGAAARAQEEDWPDDAWRDWRYRRASLAHLLARQGMMQDVGNAYLNVESKLP